MKTTLILIVALLGLGWLGVGCKEKAQCCSEHKYTYSGVISEADATFPESNGDTSSLPVIYTKLPYPLPFLQNNTSLSQNINSWNSKIDFSKNSLLSLYLNMTRKPNYRNHNIDITLDTSAKMVSLKWSKSDYCPNQLVNGQLQQCALSSTQTKRLPNSIYFIIPKVDSTYQVDFQEIIQ